MHTEPEWQRLYQMAVLETDWSKMGEHIRAADKAIKSRLHEFSLDHGGTPEENKSIADALERLDILRGDVARWQKRKSLDE